MVEGRSVEVEFIDPVKVKTKKPRARKTVATIIDETAVAMRKSLPRNA
ncbi:hypothetical protein WOA01_14170 [Methylocystis sp. IM2]